MTLLRRVSYGALALAFAHIVFGAIVRITGSGLGCGDHWPQCHGYWFPPFTRMDLVIEVMHRYLAFGLSVTIAGLLLLAFRRRAVPGVGGPGGVLRPIALAAVLVVTAAVFGGIVVKLELRNKYVIVVHLAIAIATLASLAMAVIRAGGLGGALATAGTASPRTWRAARAAAAMAFVAVVLGGLTAHVVGANGACVGFPHCSRGIPTPGAPLHIHLTHRVVAFLLFFHLLGMTIAVRKRRESALMQWATRIAFGTVLLQIVVAAALVELFLPPVLRSLHQAVGTLVWLSIFVLAALARRGSRDAGDGAVLAPEPPRLAPEPDALPRGAATVATVAANLATSAIVAAPVAVASAESPAVEVEVVPMLGAVAAGPATDEATSLVATPVALEPAVVEPQPVDDLPVAGSATEVEESVAEAPAVEVPVIEVAVVEASVVESSIVPDALVDHDVPEDDFDREVAARLEAVVGRDPFDDDEDDVVAAEEDEEPDADEDFASVIAAQFAAVEDEVEDEPETDEIDAATDIAVPAEAMVAVEPVVEPELAIRDAAPIDEVPIAAMPRLDAPVVDAPVAVPVVAADVAVLPSMPKRPPTLAVLIARGADF